MVHLTKFFVGYFFIGSSNSKYNQDQEHTTLMLLENYKYIELEDKERE